MTLYIFNTLIAPVNFDEYPLITITFRKVSIEEAKKVVSASQSQFVSAIGHEGTAKLLSRLLGVQIPTNRITVFMEPGDIGLHFFLKQRLPEGKILTEDEVKKLDYWLVLSEIEEEIVV